MAIGGSAGEAEGEASWEVVFQAKLSGGRGRGRLAVLMGQVAAQPADALVR